MPSSCALLVEVWGSRNTPLVEESPPSTFWKCWRTLASSLKCTGLSVKKRRFLKLGDLKRSAVLFTVVHAFIHPHLQARIYFWPLLWTVCVNGDCGLLCWVLSRNPLLLEFVSVARIHPRNFCLVLLLQLPGQYFLVCVGAPEGPLLDHGASAFPSVILKHSCQAFTVCHVSRTCKADTISFVIVTDEFF